MNKRLFLGVLSFMIVSMLSVGLVSCGSDSDNEKESIDVDNVIGIWICTASHDSWDGGSEEGYMVNKYLIVNSDGTYESSSKSMGNGSYVISGNKLTAKTTSGRTITATVSINGNTLILNGSTDDGYKFNYTFVRDTSTK